MSNDRRDFTAINNQTGKFADRHARICPDCGLIDRHRGDCPTHGTGRDGITVYRATPNGIVARHEKGE